MPYRAIEAQLLVDWTHDSTYVDESARLMSASGNARMAPPYQSITGSSGQIPTASFLLNNASNRYSPLIASGALYSAISGGKLYRTPVRFRVSVDGGSTWATIFQGVAKLPKVDTLSQQQPKAISLDCRGNLEKLLNYRVNIEQTDFVSWLDTGIDEGTLIETLLDQYVGLDPAEYSIDRGAFVLRNVPADNISVVELCWQLAAATGGRYYTNKGGGIRYWNWTGFLREPAAVSSQATLDRSTFAAFASYYDDRDLASKVAVRGELAEVDASDTVWQRREALVIPPGESVAIEATWSDGLYRIDSVDYRAHSAGGVDLAGSVSLTRTDYARRMRLEFTNSHATLAAYISGLAIAGSTVSTEEFSEEVVSANAFWGGPTRPDNSLMQRAGNDYVQSRAQAAALAAFVLGRQEVPALYYDIKGAPGNPDLDLFQRVTIDDPETMDDPRDAFIIGLRWQYGPDVGFRQDIEAIDTAALYPYIDASPSYFRLSVNKLGSSDPGRGRIFY